MYQIPPIENEYDFENLICDLFNAIENTSAYQTFGVKGQKQKGIDIFPVRSNRTLIQCKKKDISKKDEKIRNTLINELDTSLNLAKSLEFKYNRFILASTYKSDAKIQEHAAKKTDELNLTVEYWGWEKISSHLKTNLSVLAKYYPDFSLKLPVPKNSLIPFKHNQSFKILVLKFNVYGESKSGDFEKALFNYYNSLANEDESNLEIRIKNIENGSLKIDTAEKIRVKEQVDMVIWGSYESDSQSKEVVLRYTANFFNDEIKETTRYDFRKLLDIEGGLLPANLHYLTHFTLGVKAYLMENYTEAISEFFILMNGFEIIDFHLVAYTADSYLKMGDYEKAKVFYKIALEYKPELDFLYYQLGTVYYSLQEYTEAFNTYSKGLEINPQQHDSLFYLGKTCEELGNSELAKEYYQKSIKINSIHTPAYYALSHLLYSEGEYLDAQIYAQIIIPKFPEDYEFLNLLGNIYAELSNPTVAIEQFEEAIRLNPQFSAAYNNLALVQQNIKEFEKAESNYNLAIKIEPTNPIFYCNYGQLFFDSNRANEAIPLLKKAIELKSNYFRPYNLLGVIHAETDIIKSMNYYMLAFGHGSDLAKNNTDRLCDHYNIPRISDIIWGFISNSKDNEELNHTINIMIEIQKIRLK